MQKNNDLTLFTENNMADVLQQEMAQRLLAIRMNAALYSRRNEGRQTQELADQAVNMTDEVIQQFEYLLNLMRLPRVAFEQGVIHAVAVLKKSVEGMGVLRCSFDVPQTCEKFSSSDAFFVFQVLHGIVLQLMQTTEKTLALTVKLIVDADQKKCVMVIHVPNSHEQLLFLQKTLDQRIATHVAYNSKDSELQLTVPVSERV